MKFTYHIILLSLFIAGCAYQPPKDVNSSFYSPPAGSRLLLNSALTIPANDTQVRIQDGKVIHSIWDYDAYYANCNFELRQIAEVERTIQPDSFAISRVVRDTENVMLNSSTMVASANLFASSNGGPPNVDYMVIMDLHSPRQPEVARITCRHWEDPNEASHLTITQIRKTLGDLFTLNLAKHE